MSDEAGVTPHSSTACRPAHPGSILYVTPECSDFVKAGGLGEVSAALPRALQKHYDVRVLIPAYRAILAAFPDLPIVGHLPAAFGLPSADLGLIQTADGLTVYVLLCPELYDRDGNPYGDARGIDWPDNHIRFGRLGLAAADIAAGTGDPAWRPDVLHLNDWTTAMAPAYMSWRGQDTASVLTIHNLAYQGLFPRQSTPALGVPGWAFQAEGVEFFGKLSFLKAGIFYASHITTVSETYAREITSPEFGCGLDGLLRKRAEEGQLDGILNGIDESWDPASDRHLPVPFSLEDCAGKRASARYVRNAFNLSVSRGPLFALISRLVHQKGIDIAVSAAAHIVESGGQLVVTGQGERQLEDALESLAERYPGQVGVRIGYDEAEAHRMFAGSDFFLMPSRFEPCGLGQMYAQRFGSLPIARRTGGLADTIEDGVTGFLFSNPSVPDLTGAVRRAIGAYGCQDRLKSMRRAAMDRPAGWSKALSTYGEIYARALRSAAA